MDKRLYIKKNGKYIKASDPDIMEGGLREGAYLMIVRPNSRSVRTILSPKLAELNAALEYLREGLCQALMKASQLRPKTEAISEKEQRAWKNFQRTMGKDVPSLFCYSSNSDIADKACEYVKEVLLKYNFDLEKIKEAHTIKKQTSKNVIMDMDLE